VLPTGNTNTLSEATTKSITSANSVAMDFEIKLDATATLYVSPTFSKNRITNKNNGFDATFDENGPELNQNTCDNKWSSDANTFKNNLNFYKSFKKKGRGISATIENENSKNESGLITKTSTTFFQYGAVEDNRNQVRIYNAKNFLHSAKLEFTSYWPQKVVIGSDFGYNYNSNIADGFQKDFYLWNLSLVYSFFQDKWLAKIKVYDVLNQNISAPPNDYSHRNYRYGKHHTSTICNVFYNL
jgi:hypothetical protein